MRKTKTILALMLFLIIANSANATIARVRQLTAEESEMLVQNLQKIVIQEDMDHNVRMSIYDLTGAIISDQEINSPAKISFLDDNVEIETSVENVEVSSRLSFYPNPAKDYIHIIGLQGNELVRLYNMQGQIIVIQKGSDVNVSSLSPGTYILLVGKQCFKVIIE